MTRAQKLLDILAVEELDALLFRGNSIPLPLPRVFGGQVLAQALNAAVRTVASDQGRPHSLHAYFLRPGDMSRPILYEVDPIRNGRSFTTRRVVAKQGGKAIFNASISFHTLEDGLDHQMDMPEGIPGPEGLEADTVRYQRLLAKNPDAKTPLILPRSVIETRTPFPVDYTNPKAQEPHQGFWFKFQGDLSQDPIQHRCILALISDLRLMSTALLPHGINFTLPGFMGASLDHAIWFHGDIRVDQWIYFHMDSPRALRARGFNRGSFYTRSGQLIASCAQEGLMRTGRGDPKDEAS